MKESLKPRFKGNIKITNTATEEVLYDDSNTISGTALLVALLCLTQISGPRQLDTIVASGSDFLVSTNITHFTYNNSTETLTLKATFDHSSFNGTVTNLELRSTSLNLQFATKAGLDIAKDGQSALQIEWSINVEQC